MTLLALGMVLGTLPGGLPELIATPEQAERLCHDLLERPYSSDLPVDPVDRASFESGWGARRAAALGKLYAVEVPAGLFHFGRYEDGELLLDDAFALLGAGGGLAVYPADGPWAFAATPEQAHRAFQLWRQGRVKLEIAFRPAEDGCNGIPYARSHSLAVASGFLALLGDGGEVVLAGDGDWAPPPAELQPRLRVQPPVVVSGQADPGAIERVIEGDAGLRDCYRKALSESADAGGDLVIEAEIGPPGVVQTSRVALDGLGDAALTRCLRERFQSLQLTGAGAGARLYVPIELGDR